MIKKMYPCVYPDHCPGTRTFVGTLEHHYTEGLYNRNYAPTRVRLGV